MLAVYVLAQATAWLANLLMDAPILVHLAAAALCIVHALHVLPRHVLLVSPHAVTGLRRDRSGWAVWTVADGWQAAQLRPDSMALPQVVVLRFRLVGQRRVRSACVLPDCLDADTHRRLRLRLKFSRRRWAVPG
nr:protein YgfX [Pseudomonas sp. CFBP 13719]